jgi:hypothetical protein
MHCNPHKLMSNQTMRRNARTVRNAKTVLSAIALSLFALPALAEGVYMGTASTEKFFTSVLARKTEKTDPAKVVNVAQAIAVL